VPNTKANPVDTLLESATGSRFQVVVEDETSRDDVQSGLSGLQYVGVLKSRVEEARGMNQVKRGPEIHRF
jgi:hypothetical protein